MLFNFNRNWQEKKLLPTPKKVFFFVLMKVNTKESVLDTNLTAYIQYIEMV